MAANNAPNMKVVVGADTSQFDKGMRAAKAQVRDFSKVSSDALSKLGEAFGVNTAQIEKVTNAIGGLGQRMSQAGSEGTKAFGNLLSSVTKLNTGLVGLGLAGVVASFKALNAEAENFKSTVAGANIELQTQAYINTYRQVLHDTNSETGRAVAEWQANWQKGAARLGANIQQNFVASLRGTALSSSQPFRCSARSSGVVVTENRRRKPPRAPLTRQRKFLTLSARERSNL